MEVTQTQSDLVVFHGEEPGEVIDVKATDLIDVKEWE